MTLRERIFNIVQSKEKHVTLISEWEQDFVDSIHAQVKKGRDTLSSAQNSILQKIEAKLSDDAIARQTSWEASWDAEKQNIARIVAKYYLHSGYYTSVAERVIAEPEWIMPESLYNKMCGNKYAKKVLNEAATSPKYKTGDAVMLRATAPSRLFSWQDRKKLANNTPLFVISVDAEIKSAVKGAKIYNILPAGHPTTFQVEERWLKKYKVSKKKDKIIVDNDLPF